MPNIYQKSHPTLYFFTQFNLIDKSSFLKYEKIYEIIIIIIQWVFATTKHNEEDDDDE